MADFWQVLCCSLSILIYLNTLNGGFVYDDRRAILQNGDVESGISANPISDIWKNDFWGSRLASDNSHGSYRPFCVLTFRLNHWLSSLSSDKTHNAVFYHLTNVLLHGLATGLTLKLARIVLPIEAANLSGLLFAVHPIHTEAVANVVGRADVLACVLSLCCFLSYLHYRNAAMPDRNPKNADLYLLSVVLFGASAALSKETGFAALPICCCYETALILHHYSRDETKKRVNSVNNFSPNGERNTGRSSRWKTLKLLLICTFSLILFRLKMSDGRIPRFSTADNPTAKSDSTLIRFLTFSYLPVFNFYLLLYPFDLSYDWSMDSIPRIRSFHDSRNFYALIFYVGLVVCGYVNVRKIFDCRLTDGDTVYGYRCCRSNYSLLLALILLTIPFLPATNLLVYVGFVVAERILYLPSVGYCLLIGSGWWKLTSKIDNKFLTNALFGTMIILFGVRTVLRNEDWNNEEKLYKSGLRINPAKSYGNLGCILSDEGRIVEAEKAFREALRYRYNMADVHYNLALLLEKTGRSDEALNSYQLAIRFRPNFAVAFLKLGELLSNTNQSEKAESILIECVGLTTNGVKDPQTQNKAKMEAWLHLGRLYTANGSYGKALDAYKQAAIVSFRFNYQPPQVFYNLIAETLVKMKRFEEAENLFEMILHINPDNKGNVNRNRTEEPNENFKIVRLEPIPENIGLYLFYAQLLYDKKKFVESAAVYKTAAFVFPDDHQLNVQTAYVCKIAKLWPEAEYFYKRALFIRTRNSTADNEHSAV